MFESSEPLDRALGFGQPAPSNALEAPPALPVLRSQGARQAADAVYRLASLLESHQALLESAAQPEVLNTLHTQIQREAARLVEGGLLPGDLLADAADPTGWGLQRLRNFLQTQFGERTEPLTEGLVESPHPVLRLGLAGNVLGANRAGEVFHAALTAQMAGKSAEWLRELIGRVIRREPENVLEVRCGGRDYALSVSPIPDASYVYLYAHDVSELKEASRAAEHLALRDPLTGLPNRLYLRQRFEQSLEYCERSRCALTVAFLDLDNFKQINDTFGHAAGDRTLKCVGACLRESLDERNAVARWGGDEFVVLFPQLKARDARLTCDHLLKRVARRMGEEAGYVVTLSYGVGSYPNDGRELDQLLQVADSSLLRAKRERHAGRWRPVRWRMV